MKMNKNYLEIGHDIVERHMNENIDIKKELEKASEGMSKMDKVVFYSHINSLYLNVLVNRLDYVGEEGERKALESRLIIKNLIENER